MDLPTNSMKGRTVLITGGTAGIGKETARGLAHIGAQVVIIGRNKSRGENVVQELRQSTRNNEVHFLEADLSSQEQVHQLANDFQGRFSKLHVLVNNVAGIYRHRQETVDGIEATLALGHLAPFLLTHLLLPLMRDNAPARIVNVSSDGHIIAKLDFDDLQAKRFYRALDIYVRVKLMNLLFTYELARQLSGTGITVNAVDPGGAHTQLTDSTTSDMLPPMLRLLYPLISRFTFTSVKKAAESSIYAAASPDIVDTTGKYIGTKLKETASSKLSHNVEVAHRLWHLSEELTGIRAGEKLAN